MAEAPHAPAQLLSLCHLTVLDATPLELLEAAEAGGFNAVGLRIHPPMPTDTIVPVVGDEPMIRAIKQRLDDTGLTLLDVEVLWLMPDTDVAACLPMLDVAGRLGARHLVVAGNDPDEARATANFARLCELARPFGLAVMIEFIPYCQTRTLADAQRLVAAAAQANGGALVDTLHLHRSGGTAADLAGLDAVGSSYVQVCDARGPAPEGVDARRREARGGRYLPGEGELDLVTLLAAFQADVAVGIEAPCAAHAGWSVADRAVAAGEAGRRLLAEVAARR